MRVLRRPMFRIGGSAGEGITSGLVPRQGYQGTGNPGDQRVLSEYEKEALDRYQANQRLAQMIRRPSGPSPADALIEFGLNLASAPPTGSIFSTAAGAAKPAYQNYVTRKQKALSEQQRFDQALLGDTLDQLSKERQKSRESSSFASEKEQENYDILIKKQRALEKKLREAEKVKASGPEEKGYIIEPNQEEIARIKEELEDNAKLQSLYSKNEKDPVRAAILKGISNGVFTFDDLIVYDKTGVPPTEESKAEGGRIGYQNAGPVMPTSMPEQQQPVMNPQPNQQDLTFEELRSRLPESVTDDIIQLLVNSEEALTEFANIQTAQDIAFFNRKYQVNLVLPQEA